MWQHVVLCRPLSQPTTLILQIRRLQFSSADNNNVKNHANAHTIVMDQHWAFFSSKRLVSKLLAILWGVMMALP